MQHPDPSGWNRFKNKTLGVSWLNVFMFFSAMYFSIIVDDGVGLLIADAGFLVDNGRSVFYADTVGHFASDP
ncbi:hypothetical protein [Neisseria sp. Marseille-Q5346]|uniref:hypothetical protein n=1 Tax=unclassified Neisseria TaxID=2623750 RepID=UPI0021DF66DE|nr:hypothetical protein [Neisseria sp. Marseille-Q5346]